MWVQVPSPAYRQEESRFVEPALFLSASRSPLNPWVQGLRLASKASVRRNHRLRPIRLKTAHRAVFLTPNPHLPQHSFVEIRHIVWRIFFAFPSSRIYPCFTHVRCNAYRFAISFGEKIKIIVDRKIKRHFLFHATL